MAVAVAIVLFVVQPVAGRMRDGRDVRDWADSLGPAAPLVFIAVSASLTPLMFPGPLLAGASGLLFGIWARLPGHARERRARRRDRVLDQPLGRAATRSSAWPGPRIVAIEALLSRARLRLRALRAIMPGMPYTLVNYAAG